MSTKEEQTGMVRCYIGHHSVLISCENIFHLLGREGGGGGGHGSSVGMGKSDEVTLPLVLKADEVTLPLVLKADEVTLPLVLKADEVTLPLVLKAGMTSVFRQVMGEGEGATYSLLLLFAPPPQLPPPGNRTFLRIFQI